MTEDRAARRAHSRRGEHSVGASGGRRREPSRPADALRQLYGGKGVTGEQEVIAYCRIGEEP